MTGKVNMRKSKQLFWNQTGPRPLSPTASFAPCVRASSVRTKGMSCEHRATISSEFHLWQKRSLGTSSCRNFAEFAQKLSQTASLTEDHYSSKTNSPSLFRSLRTQVSDRNSPKFSETCRAFYCLTETHPSLPRNLHT